MIALTPGQEIRLETDGGRPLSTLRMGVGWDKEATAGAIGTGAPDVDLAFDLVSRRQARD